MRSEAQKRADKKYNSKSGLFSLMYRPKEILEAKRLRNYLETNGISANSYLKSLIKKDLDSKGIPYPNEREPEP